MALSRHRLLQALAGEQPDRPPIWLMRQAGRHLPEYRELRAQTPDFIAFCRNPQACCQAALQPLDRYGLDATIVFSDILTLVDAWGQTVRFEKGKGPILSHTLQPGDVQHLPHLDLAKVDYVFEAVHTLKQAVRDELPLIGFSGSPWTLATYMIEGSGSKTFTHARQWPYAHPQALNTLLKRLAEIIGAYLAKQVQAGADVVMLFDTWGGLLGHHEFPAVSLAAMRKTLTAFRSHPGCQSIPAVVFTKGGAPWLKQLAELDCQALGVDWTCDLAEVRKEIPSQMGLQGNVDPALLLGSQQTIEMAVKRCRHAMQGRHNYIGNLGHGILPETPPENVKHFIDCWKHHVTSA